MINLSVDIFIVKDGDRICQKVIGKHERAYWIIVYYLVNTMRDSVGFGHTGKEKS